MIGTAGAGRAADDPNPPADPVRLIFLHHSTGENSLDNSSGGRGSALRGNDYFASDTNYGWGPDAIGNRTDIGGCWAWFRGPDSADYMRAVYSESADSGSRAEADSPTPIAEAAMPSWPSQ